MDHVLEQSCPECHWVPVTDAAGRRRMEMRWALPAAPVDVQLRRAA